MRKADRRAACQRPWARFGPGGTSPHSPAGLRRSPPQPPFTIRWQCGRLSGGSRLAAELSVVGCDCAAMLCTCDMAAMMPAFGSPPETAVKCVRVFQCVYTLQVTPVPPASRTGTAPPRRGPCVSFYSGSPRPCPVFSSLSPGCRAVELSRLRRAAVEVLSRPCLSSLSSSCRVAVEPVEASRD